MRDLLGFLSYVHADDALDDGRIQDLGRDIVGHYEAITAEAIELFLDRDDLHWGDEWHDKIDDALSNVAFFIPIITPRYFTRVECRRELQFFADRAGRLGITQLILPILYIDVSELHQDEPTDALMRLVKRFQWTPWIDLRFKSRTSPEYRTEVDLLARELVRRVAAVEALDIVAAAEAIERTGSEAGAEPGTLDRLAALEEAMPRWNETLTAIGAEVQTIGDLMTVGTEDTNRADSRGQGFAARLTVARRVAHELEEPVERIEGLSQKFVADLNEIDTGLRVLFAQLEIESTEDAATIAQICEFLETIRSLSVASHNGLGATEGMIEASGTIEKISKDMRAPMRRLKTSLTAMLEAREITDSWVAMADAVSVDCSGGLAV